MTDKSARDEIARHYGAFEIGGSLDDMYESEREHCYDFADRLIAALEAGGFAVVPKEPTEAMLRALSVETVDGEMRVIWMHQVRVDWSAMLAASNPKEEGK